jgi:hypothetical protein
MDHGGRHRRAPRWEDELCTQVGNDHVASAKRGQVLVRHGPSKSRLNFLGLLRDGCADEDAWQAHLDRLGVSMLRVTTSDGRAMADIAIWAWPV